MKKLLFFTSILITNFFIQTQEVSETTHANNQDNALIINEHGELATKNHATESILLKILQDENERLAKELHAKQESEVLIHSYFFGAGLITGLLLGIIIHLHLTLNYTDQMIKQVYLMMHEALKIQEERKK